jgi:hypothetical protein
MSYVASICFSVCLYHSLLEYNILQQWVAPDVSADGVQSNLPKPHKGVGCSAVPLAGSACRNSFCWHFWLGTDVVRSHCIHANHAAGVARVA